MSFANRSKILNIVLLVVILLSGIFTYYLFKNEEAIVMEYNADEVDKTIILSEYEQYKTTNLYIDNIKYLESSSKTMLAVYENLPEHITTYINGNWTVIVSEKEPIEYEENGIIAAGITYYEWNIIWLEYDFDERTFAHECGHAYDELLMVSYSKEFTQIYEKYKNSYIEYGMCEIREHSISSSSEFFAALFSDYILHSDYVNEKAPEIKMYFDRILY